MPTLRDHALRLAAAGYRVFPLAPNSKIPALDTDWRQIATSDADSVRRLWTDPVMEWDQPFNIGVALDADVLVVDVDVSKDKKGRESLHKLAMLYDPLPGTYSVKTASGGHHYYFRVDPRKGPFGKNLAEHIDLKTLGGYVVGEGSVINNRRYNGFAGSPDDLEDFPAEYLEAAKRAAPATAKTTADTETDSPDAIARAIEYLERSAPDHGTYKVACRVKDFGISQEKCADLLSEHWDEPRSLGKGPEHIAVRVANAYRYGQNAVGAASPEFEFEAVEVAPASRGKLYFDKWDDNTLPPEELWLIEGWYDRGAMVVSYGESNAGKSNVVLSQCVAVATGQPWAGCRTRQGLVVYVAAEGARGFRKRIEAYKKRFGMKGLPFALVPCHVDLLRPSGDTKALIELIGEAEAAFGQKCAMVVIDTLFRALAGGNENAPEDMGALVKHCDAIRAATGATLHVIHHSGKNVAAGARGHSSLKAATDTEIEIEGDKSGGRVLATKQRDMDKVSRAEFRYEVVNLGRVSSIVTHAQKETEFNSRVPDAAREMFEVLVGLQESNGGAPVEWTAWEGAYMSRTNKPPGRSQRFYYRQSLSAARMVQKSGQLWSVSESSDI